MSDQSITRTPERASGEDFSPLAWELARSAALSVTAGGGVRARVRLGGRGVTVQGLGATSTDALRDLARELDKWSERACR